MNDREKKVLQETYSFVFNQGGALKRLRNFAFDPGTNSLIHIESGQPLPTHIPENPRQNRPILFALRSGWLWALAALLLFAIGYWQAWRIKDVFGNVLLAAYTLFAIGIFIHFWATGFSKPTPLPKTGMIGMIVLFVIVSFISLMGYASYEEISVAFFLAASYYILDFWVETSLRIVLNPEWKIYSVDFGGQRNFILTKELK